MAYEITKTVTLTFAAAPVNSADRVNQDLLLQEILDPILQENLNFHRDNPGRPDVLLDFKVE